MACLEAGEGKEGRLPAFIKLPLHFRPLFLCLFLATKQTIRIQFLSSDKMLEHR